MISRLAEPDPDRELAVDGQGDPYADEFARAFAQWVYCQDEPPTIEHASMVWNATPDVIRQAIEEHYWLFESNGRIESDGI